MLIDLQSVEQFLDAATKAKPAPTEGIRESLEELSVEVERVLSTLVNKRGDSSPEFNLLRITRRAHYEVTTHSALLAELLDPLGRHEQGGLFLSAFLKRIMTIKTRWGLPDPDTHWIIQKERDFIDIRLIHSATKTRILVENKWWAKHREMQLYRYWSDEHSRTNNKLKSIPIVYLTRAGEAPNPTQLPTDNKRFMSDLLLLSYKFDILQILRETMPEVKSSRVRESLLQYSEILEVIP